MGDFDIVCERGRDGEALVRQGGVPFPQRHVHHSPSGFEWGYHGSGPADLALNILDDNWRRIGFVTAEHVETYGGSLVPWEVELLYQQFKQEVVAAIPFEGGVVRDDAVREWLVRQGAYGPADGLRR